MSIVIGFLGSQSAATVRPVAIAERTVFYRETVAGMYSALPYAFSQVCIIHSLPPTYFISMWQLTKPYVLVTKPFFKGDNRDSIYNG